MELVHFTSKAIVELQSSFSLGIVTTQVLEKPRCAENWTGDGDQLILQMMQDTLLSLGV